MKLKKLIIAVVGVIAVIAAVIVADYFALFGTTTRTNLAFAEARFRTLDKDNGNLIVGAVVRCFQQRNNNACTLRDSHQAGVVAVHVPYKRITESSLFFMQDETIEKAADPRINVMFIHADYMNTTKSLLLDDIFTHPGKEYTVEMQARNWGNTDGEAE